jgi:RNA recognition motif-containing protein
MQQRNRIVVGNFPAEVTQADIRLALRSYGEVEKIHLVTHKDGIPEVLIEISTSFAQAESVASRISKRTYQGRLLRAWVTNVD